ncbi:MAG: 4Fe-4S binding protein [Negativicutes bacterium]|nr:4Fe-4S binding protein [Negativicutes bacterium]
MRQTRLATQILFVLGALYTGYRHQLVGGGPGGAGPLDAYCPFGALETLPTYLFFGSFLAKTAFSNFWFLLALLATIFLVGSVFCGWICPLGSLGDWLYRIRDKFFFGTHPAAPAAGPDIKLWTACCSFTDCVAIMALK